MNHTVILKLYRAHFDIVNQAKDTWCSIVTVHLPTKIRNTANKGSLTDSRSASSIMSRQDLAIPISSSRTAPRKVMILLCRGIQAKISVSALIVMTALSSLNLLDFMANICDVVLPAGTMKEKTGGWRRKRQNKTEEEWENNQQAKCMWNQDVINAQGRSKCVLTLSVLWSLAATHVPNPPAPRNS